MKSFSTKASTMVIASLLISCTSLPIKQLPSANSGERIKFLVLHYTALDYGDSVTALVDEGGLSSHYLVPEDNDVSYGTNRLTVMQLVDESKRAWHAGKSYWQGRRALNDQSIGIEIVNKGRCKLINNVEKNDTALPTRVCDFPDFSSKQIALTTKLIQDILKRNPDIGPSQIIGHADIAPARKQDPGPKFPWLKLHQSGIGAWYEQASVDAHHKLFSTRLPTISTIQKALRGYGYGILETGIFDQQSEDTLQALQYHFLPTHNAQQFDNTNVAVIFALLEKYFPKKHQQLIERYRQQSEPKNNPVELINAQFSQVFPEVDRSTRELVNDRMTFKGYQGRGTIVIENNDAKNADIYINGQKINIADPLVANKRYQYSLAKRTRTGVNTLRVDNVVPQGASVKVSVLYPTLEDKTKAKQHDFSQVDEFIADEIANGFPGAVLLVIKDGNIIKNSAYGYAKKYSDGGNLLISPVKMTNETVFDIASNTKMFATNFALMKLVSEGRLDVNKSISYYLPDYVGQGKGQRLVKDILSHSAGYAPQVRFHTPDNDLGEHFFSQQPERTKQLILNKVGYANGRGDKQIYSDTDYMLLGMLIERITEQPLDTYAESALYTPLELDMVFNPLQKGVDKSDIAATEIKGNTRGERVSFPNVRNYVLQGEVHDEKAFHSFAGVAGHAGLFSTAKDLAVLSQLMLNGGGYDDVRLFDKRVVEQFTKAGEGKSSYGLGWRRASHGDLRWHFGAYASDSAYGHTGWTGTATVIDPKHDLAIVLLTNVRHSLVEGDDKNYEFAAKHFETGRYGSVMSLIYEAVLNK